MSNVPKLRFKELSGEWDKERFGELCGFEQGVQVDVELQHQEPKDNLVRFIRIENYTQNSKDFRFIPKELAKKKSIDEKEIAIVRYGATAGFIGRGFDGVLANNLFKLKPNHKLLDDEYLYHYLKSYKAFHFFQSEMAGGAMPALSFGIVKALKLPYPSKQEQEKIASFLTSVDIKIEQLTKKEELLKQYKKGVMQKIFSGEVRFKADDGSDYPEWEEKKLGDMGTTFNGLTGKTSENFGSGKPYIQYKQIFDNSRISVDGFGYVSIEPNEKQNKAQFGDIFFTTSSETPNEVAFASVLLDDIEEVYLNSFCFGYRAKSLDILNPYFARYLFRNANFRKEAIKLAQGSTRYNISKVELMKTIIGLPCLEEQTKIANFLSSIDSKCEQVQKQLDSTKEFKKALLQQMFV